jgi:hypothetical protein
MDNTICTGSVIGFLTREGLETTLQAYPELLASRGLLEEILWVYEKGAMHERLARDCDRRLDELSFDLEDVTSTIQP